MKRIIAMIVVSLCAGILAVSPVLAATSPALSFLTDAVYDEVGYYSEGLVWVKEDGVYKYLDQNGKVVIDLSEKKYTLDRGYKDMTVQNFHEGLACITIYNEENPDPGATDAYYIDTKGNIVLSLGQVNKKINNKELSITRFCSSFAEGITIADCLPQADTYFVDKEGNYRSFPITMDYSYWYTEGLLCSIRNDGLEGGQWGYVDSEVNTAIPFVFEAVRPFNQGLAPVMKNGKWGFIDKSGKVIIKYQFTNFWVTDSNYTYKVFNDGLACVQKDGKWGFINKAGKTVIPFEYAQSSSFVNGYATVKNSDGTYSYINKKGKTLFKTKYADANCFTEKGIAIVGSKGVYKLINAKGTKVSKETWKFDATAVTAMDPDAVFYKKNDKWGIAKIVD
ncbi:MAG TPA: WG repeat-containing protein [Clostridiales bacterium]|nr:WG repeat-containing protein [Clostridiales bacterium]